MNDEIKVTDMGQVIQVDEARIRDHLGELVRGSVEEALNAMLDAEADTLCAARMITSDGFAPETPAVSLKRQGGSESKQPGNAKSNSCFQEKMVPLR